MRAQSTDKTSVSFVPVLLATCVLYLPALRIWAYGDDFSYLGAAAVPATRWQLFRPMAFALRPVDRLANGLNAGLLGFETTLVTHLISLSGFVISVCLVSKLARLLFPASGWVSLIPATLFAVHPANVMSVLQIDTVCQQFATAFELSLLWTLLTMPVRSDDNRTSRIRLSSIWRHMLMIAMLGWLAIGTHEKVRLALGVAARNATTRICLVG